MSLAAAVPVLPVRDIASAVAFYVEKLGFTEIHSDESYAVLARDAVEIHLWAARDESWRTRGGEQPIVTGAESFLAGTASCRVREPDIDALYAACRSAGIVHPNGPLADKPWGLREFAVLDGDGNQITFFSPIADGAREQTKGAPTVDDTQRFEKGLENRKAVLGVEHVERSFAKAGAFATPWQDFVTKTAWHDVWGDETLPWKTRSMIVLTICTALHREEEFKLHLRPALKNGVTIPELRALLIQCAVYAGVPAANAAFRWARDVLGEEADALAEGDG